MKNEAVKTTIRDREDASGNVRPFVPRPQLGRRKVNVTAADGRAASKDRASVGDDDDPGPTAA
jgi:hypothetical protein